MVGLVKRLKMSHNVTENDVFMVEYSQHTELYQFVCANKETK